jgi:hypothetical protein
MTTRRWLLPMMVILATAAVRADEPKFEYAPAFELGAAEFHGGDAITITELRCDRSAIEADATCRVKGRYVLKSKDRATLLFSVTESGAAKPTPTEARAMVKLARGEGSFTLVHKLPKGYPHLTFYDPSGHPVSGTYFGHGDSLLKVKSWRYDVGPNDNDHLGS